MGFTIREYNWIVLMIWIEIMRVQRKLREIRLEPSSLKKKYLKKPTYQKNHIGII